MDLPFDIETIPTGDPETIEVTPPKNYKNPEAIERYVEAHRDEEFRKRALQGISCEICSIAWAGPDGIRCMSSEKTGERAMLEDFMEELESMIESAIIDTNGRDRTVCWIGHNIADFDLRILWQRLTIHNIPGRSLIPLNARPGSRNIFDTMKAWSGIYGRQAYVSQDTLYEALGGPEIAYNGVDGGSVWDAWKAGEYEKVREYNKIDVQKARYIADRLMGQE